MKRVIKFHIWLLTVSIFSLLFSKLVYASDSVTFILRYVWIDSMTSNESVDAYVNEHPWANAVLLTDTSNGILSIISYNGTYEPNKRWRLIQPSPTYEQVKTVIDRFHYHGWKVFYSAGNRPKETLDSWFWNYVNDTHRELAFTTGEGKKAGLKGVDGDPTKQLNINFFANYTSDDTERGISAGERLIDVYTNRLKLMIENRHFEWDGWFGVDGWNGFTQDGYYWLWSTSILGRTMGASQLKDWVDASYQSFEEWENSKYTPSYDFPFSYGSRTFSISNNFDGYSIGEISEPPWKKEGQTANVSNSKYLSSPNSLNLISADAKYVADGSFFWTNLTLKVAFYREQFNPNWIGVWGFGENWFSSYGLYLAQNDVLKIYKDGDEQISATITPLQANTWNWFKLSINASANKAYIKGKAWEVGNPEPDWQVSWTDTSNIKTKGAIGFYSPQRNIYWDNLTVSGHNLGGSWATMSNIEKGEWVRGRANHLWWRYWSDRFAQMYAQIKQVFVETRPPEFYGGTIISQSVGAQWAGGGNVAPIGMNNISDFIRHNSFDHYYIDVEWYGDFDSNTLMGRRQAYVAGLVKSYAPEAHSIMGIQSVDSNGGAWDVPSPLWVRKQEYLAMAQTYAWKNGRRYRAVDPTTILLWVRTNTTWSDETFQTGEFAEWVNAMVNYLNDDGLSQVWLGPVYTVPIYHRGNGIGYPSISFTLAQFTDVMNIKNHPEYITSDWGTLFMDAIMGAGEGTMEGNKNKITSMFASNNLNVIYHGYGSNAEFVNTLVGENTLYESTFNLTNPPNGATGNVHVLNENEITDSYAKWIASGHYGNSYTVDEYGTINYSTAFKPIVTYDDGYLELGIYYNSTSGRFLYGRSWSSPSHTPTVKIPRAVINRAIYWASDSPINSSEPLLDLKVLNKSGTYLIPMMNLKDFNGSLTSTLKINTTRMGLGSISDYIFYWLSDWDGSNYITSFDWSNVQVKLEDGADVLVIKPKPIQPEFLTANELLQSTTWSETSKRFSTKLTGLYPTRNFTASFYIPEGIYPNDNFKVSCNGTQFSKAFNSISRILTVYCSI